MSRTFHHIAVSILLTAALLAQEPGAPTFASTTKLVTIPFNVQRGKYFAADLQPSDVILREDGHPREFTVFEGPNTPHPLPLELVLLFDTSNPPKTFYGPLPPGWDAKSEYEFVNNWDESITRTVLEKNGMDVRLSVYHFEGGQFERLCGATRDPLEIVSAIRRLLDPIPAGVNTLALLPDDKVRRGPMVGSTGWWKESTVATLKDAAASPLPARRLVILFSDLMGGTGGTPFQVIVNQAVASGIEIDPLVLDLYRQAAGRGSSVRRITGGPENPGGGGFSIPVDQPGGKTVYVDAPFTARIGEMTGGEAWVPEHLNRDALANILLRIRDTTLSKYLVGFVPEATDSPRKHKLQVELKSKSAGKMIDGERDGVVY